SYAASSQKVFEVLETEKLSLNLNVDDPDADRLVYTFTNPLDKNGEWQTTYGDAGEYKSKITVSDGVNEVSEDVAIIVHRKDEMPVIERFFPEVSLVTIDEGNNVKFSIDAFDLNKDELSYTWTINDNVVSNEKGITFETGYKDQGQYVVKVIVSDGMFNASKEWSINVNDVNLNEILDSIEDITITETETASMKLPDFRKYGLNYEISEPLGNSNKWKTGYDDSGTYDVKISVKGNDFEAEKNVVITVQNMDRPPKITGLGDASVKENENLVLEFNAEDPDGDKAAFSVENIPQGASLEGNVFKWQPDFDFVEKKNAFDYVLDSFRLLSRTVEVAFIAQSNSLKDEKTVRIRVQDSNRPFVLEDIADIEANEGKEIIIEPKYNDPDRDKVSFSYSGFITKNRKKIGFDDAGSYAVKIVASDGYHTETK
ncbi:MAG: PKD domain-containing protein, partial [Nanoarchaeota archaeon]